MCIIYHFFCSAEETIETKVILNQSLSIVDEQGMESDDDQRVVDHLSPQTLLETPTDTEVQYSFRSPEGNVFFIKQFIMDLIFHK